MNSLKIKKVEDVNVVKSGTISETRFSSNSETLDRQDLFRNEGLRRWEQGREKWIKSGNITSSIVESKIKIMPRQHIYGAIDLNVDEIIDVIVSNRWRKNTSDHGGEKETFHPPVPLPQMVDILIDLWEAEGLDV